MLNCRLKYSPGKGFSRVTYVKYRDSALHGLGTQHGFRYDRYRDSALGGLGIQHSFRYNRYRDFALGGFEYLLKHWWSAVYTGKHTAMYGMNSIPWFSLEGITVFLLLFLKNYRDFSLGGFEHNKSPSPVARFASETLLCIRAVPFWKSRVFSHG